MAKSTTARTAPGVVTPELTHDTGLGEALPMLDSTAGTGITLATVKDKPHQLRLDLEDEQGTAAGPANPCPGFRPGSTATEAQIQKLIVLTQERPRHTHELRKMGISHPAGRILDLEKRGFVYETRRITTVDSDGFVHRGVALYKLVSRPAQAIA